MTNNKGLIKVNIVPTEITYYLVTQAQIDSYANSSLVFDISLSLFSVAIGAFVGIRTSLIQSNIPQEILNKLISWSSISGTLTIVFAVITIVFIFLKNSQKKHLTAYPTDQRIFKQEE